MSYCLGIMTKFGLVMASDSRTNAGFDQVNVARKMHLFEQPGERTFIICVSGSLSCTQSILTLLRSDFDHGEGLAAVTSMYEAARVVGEKVRYVADLDRPALERDGMKYNVHLLLGGQVGYEPPGMFLVYPQGNPLAASEDTPYLQIGETKYGRPILDRGVVFSRTTLEQSVKLALLSLDSTMKSNVTVGPPIDIVAYVRDSLSITQQKRFAADDPVLVKIRQRWEKTLREGIQKLPEIPLRGRESRLIKPSRPDRGRPIAAPQSEQTAPPVPEQY